MSVEAVTGRLFHGWVIVGAAGTVMLVIFGMAYTFAAFFPALTAEFGATRGQTAIVFSLSGFIYFGIGAFSGALADRIGPRPVILAGIVLIAGALALTSLAKAIWQIYLLYGLGVGIGVGLAYVPAIGAVQRWFVRQRGFASGLAVSGIGLGTMLAPPVANALIDRFGWRGAYLGLALITAILGLGAAALMEGSPAARGLQPDGDPLGRRPAVGSTAAGHTLGEALRMPAFHLLYVSAVLVAFGLFIPFVHLAAYARDQGLGEAAAVWLVTLIGLGSLGGRFLIGMIADRIGRKMTMALCFAGLAVMMVFWWQSTALAPLALFAVVFGICYGGFVALAPAIAADHFGGRAIGAIIGVYYSAVAFGTLLGPSAAGYAYDLTGSYATVILGCAGLNVLAVLIILRLPPPRLPA